MNTKIEAKDFLTGITLEEIKTILKVKGDTHSDDPQFYEWWYVFELDSLCRKTGLSEVEKWNVLRGIFKLERR